mmetsp:Transcript_457/g.1539  ORF Transcript_457/g.1539 Transcript_457/m.1539 type:complete len:224 (+) Transcript_457:105-776(+)
MSPERPLPCFSLGNESAPFMCLKRFDSSTRSSLKMKFRRSTTSLTVVAFVPRKDMMSWKNSDSRTSCPSLKRASVKSTRPTTSTPMSCMYVAVPGCRRIVWKWDSDTYGSSSSSRPISLRTWCMRLLTKFIWSCSRSTLDVTFTTSTSTPTMKFITVMDASKMKNTITIPNTACTLPTVSISGAKSGKTPSKKRVFIASQTEGKIFFESEVDSVSRLKTMANK